jgi:hypothetical protein
MMVLRIPMKLMTAFLTQAAMVTTLPAVIAVSVKAMAMAMSRTVQPLPQ